MSSKALRFRFGNEENNEKGWESCLVHNNLVYIHILIHIHIRILPVYPMPWREVAFLLLGAPENECHARAWDSLYEECLCNSGEAIKGIGQRSQIKELNGTYSNAW